MTTPTDLALYSGIAIGAAMLLSVCYVYLKRDAVGVGGSIICVFGVALLGLSIWKTAQIKIGPAGGLEANFEALATRVNSLRVVDLDRWEPRLSKKDYVAEETGFVVAMVKADTKHRLVQARGLIDGQLIIATAAHDGTSPDVPSISINSFVMPVPKGKTWRIDVLYDRQPVDDSLESIKWFSRTARLESSSNSNSN